MQHIGMITAFTLQVLLVLPTYAGTSKTPEVDLKIQSPVCLIQTSNGIVTDLSSMCGKVDLQSSLLKIASNTISAQNQSLVTANSRSARSCQDILSSPDTKYSSVQTRLSVKGFEAKGNHATLRAVEDSVFKLEISACDSSAPEATESQQEHRFVFVQDNDQWKLSEHYIENGFTNAQPEPRVSLVDIPPMALTPVLQNSTPDSSNLKSVRKDARAKIQKLDPQPSLYRQDLLLLPEDGLNSKLRPILLAAGKNSLNRSAIVNYANKYWKDYNKDYRKFEQDCTNFVSQALRSGGWQEVPGLFTYSSYWWYNSGINQSNSWINADEFFKFTSKRPRASLATNFSDLQIGDVLQADWSNDGTKDHTMIVTKKDSRGEIYLTYHTNNTNNISISDSKRKAGSKTTYSRWKLYDKFD